VARRLTRRIAVLALIVAVLGPSVWTPSVLADADPASDTLLVTDVFLPYVPSTPVTLQRALERALNEIHRTGLNLKVAIIGSRVDLGGIPDVFGMPARYAAFLETEISYQGPQPLLVVMPDGLGIQDAGPANALAGLAIDSSQQSGGLAKTAVLAIERIAARRGRPIAGPSLDGAGGHSASPILVIAIVLALVLAIGGVFLRRRPSRSRSAA
jgi:hypothetical protein